MATLGVTITRNTVGPGAPPSIGFSSFFVVGFSPWGQGNRPILCSSFNDWTRQFGGLNKLTTLAADGSADTWGTETNSAAIQTFYAVKGYFDERLNKPLGGLWFVRSLKSSGGATAATRTFTDGGGNNTTITAKWEGAPGGTTTVTVNTPSPARGTGYAQIIVEHTQAGIAETWEIATAADAADASRRSQLVTITLPGGGQLPQTTTAKKLGNGTPGTADAYDASDADMVGSTAATGVRTGLDCFADLRLGTGMVAIPGKWSTTIRNGITSHCATYYRYGLFGTPTALNRSTILSDGNGLGSGATFTKGDFVAGFWPPVKVPDLYSASGGSVLVDPVGHVAGLQARLDFEYGGPHKSPAGIRHPLYSVIDVETDSKGEEMLTDGGSNTMADSNINTIRRKAGQIVVWGLRSFSTDTRYRQINVGRVVSLVYLSLYQIAEPYTFEPIDPDGELFARLRGDANSFLFLLRREGALYGSPPGSEPRADDAYWVECSTSNNTPVTVGAGELHLDVAIVPTLNAEKITINLLVAAPGFARRPV